MCNISYYSFAANKEVLTWGRNSYGQLGRGKLAPESESWKMEAPDIPVRFEQLAIGSEHNVALCGIYTIYAIVELYLYNFLLKNVALT